MTTDDYSQRLAQIEANAKSMEYFREMFRFAFERGVVLGLNHEVDTLTDAIGTKSINDAIAAWINSDESDGE